jgi:hypothetical protein
VVPVKSAVELWRCVVTTAVSHAIAVAETPPLAVILSTTRSLKSTATTLKDAGIPLDVRRLAM